MAPTLTPYVVSVWRGYHLTLGTFATFPAALAFYAATEDANKQLVNTELADSGSSGLTDKQLDAVYSLPATSAATIRQLAAALSLAEAA